MHIVKCYNIDLFLFNRACCLPLLSCLTFQSPHQQHRKEILSGLPFVCPHPSVSSRPRANSICSISFSLGIVANFNISFLSFVRNYNITPHCIFLFISRVISSHFQIISTQRIETPKAAHSLEINTKIRF